MTEVILGERYTPHGHQLKAHLDWSRFLILLTGRRGGKTVWGGREMPRRIYDPHRGDLAKYIASGKKYEPGARRGTSAWWERVPRLHYWVVAETYDLIDEAKRQLRLAIPLELIEHEDSQPPVWWLKPDIQIEFKTAKDPKRLVGPGLDGIWIEEAARCRHDAWHGYMRPLISDTLGWCIATTTPLGMDWTWDAFSKPAQEGRPGYAEFTWHFEDNPHNDPKEAEEAKATLPPEYFEREYHASRAAFMGQIYTRWRTEYEVDRLPPGTQFARTLAGVDWGVSNPGAIVCVGIDNRGVCWAFDEVYQRNELVEDYWVPEAQRLMETHRFKEFVADPAEPDNLTRFSRAGMNVTGHRNYGSGKFDEHARSVLSGIRLTASLIHQGKLRVVKGKCPNLLRELKGYRWATTPGGQQLEHPAPHQSDHAITAMRYVLSYAGKPAGLRAL